VSVNHSLRCIGLVLLLGSIAAGDHLPHGFPTRRGPLILVPASALANPRAETLRWLSRFDLILSNGYDLAGSDTRTYLQSSGSQLFLYVWSSGFTEREAQAQLPQSPWWQELVGKNREWLLNRESVPGPPGTPLSYYFDLSLAPMREWLADKLAQWRAQTHYDGFFFDMAGSTALPAQLRELWQARHPDLAYDQAFSGFLRAVRQADPAAVLMGNQVFKTLPAALAQVDSDLTESYGTSYAWGPAHTVNDQTLVESFFRPWEGPAGLKALYGEVDAILRRTSPRRSFIYLDYMRPRYVAATAGESNWQPELDLEAVYYSYAAARLWGREAFCSGWYAGREYQGPLYFADLGKPLGARPQEVGGLVVREYERGLVALLARPEAAERDIRLARHTVNAMYDLCDDKTIPLRGGIAHLCLEPNRSQLTRATNPVGRVFLKITQ